MPSFEFLTAVAHATGINLAMLLAWCMTEAEEKTVRQFFKDRKWT